MKQQYSSKNTSIKQVAAYYKKAIKHEILGNAEQVFDYGCGGYLQLLNDYAGAHNYCVIGYDPYNQTTEHNIQAMLMVKGCNMVVCNNVLNVLTDKDMHRAIQELKGLSVIAQSPVYITVYEGNGTGQGRETKQDCYQRNEKKEAYIQVLKQYFSTVSCKYGIIKAL